MKGMKQMMGSAESIMTRHTRPRPDDDKDGRGTVIERRDQDASDVRSQPERPGRAETRCGDLDEHDDEDG